MIVDASHLRKECVVFMTKVTKNIVKCAACGNESEQLNVYSVNYSLGSKEDNDDLMNSKQKCPKCGYESKDISKRDYVYKENDYMKIAIPSYWKQYSESNIGHPIIKFDPIGNDDVKVMFRFHGVVNYSPTIYGMYTIEKLGTASKEIYEKEFNKIVESIKIDSEVFNIIRLSNVKIDGKNIKNSDDLCVKRIYLEYLKGKTISVLDLVWAKGEIYMFNCPICESSDIDTVYENALVNVENSIISSIIVKKSDNELINKIDNKIEKLEKKEMLHKKVEESKYLIGYSKGSLIPGNTEFTSIIIVDDLIYKDINGKVEYIENQKDVIDKVWNYVNLIQGNIRTEAERIKQLPHVKDTAKDEINFKFNGEMFTLTGKITDEAGLNFYNKIVNEILAMLK